ncbi:hypothetical protein [Mycoplasma sp. P36-A1]|uniref:hypothetical protein n=1 Tax=Mycoplasma sp. P36-A1 TaxID=3252900 RepID=UPI003C2BF4DC
MNSLRKNIIKKQKYDLIISPIIVIILTASIGLFPIVAYYFSKIIILENLDKKQGNALKGMLILTSLLSVIFMITSFTYTVFLDYEVVAIICLLSTLIAYYYMNKSHNQTLVSNSIITTKEVEKFI